MYNGRNPASAMCDKAGKIYFPASRIQLSCPESRPGAAFVLFDKVVSALQYIASINFVIETVESEVGLMLGFSVSFPLERPDVLFRVCRCF